MLLITRFLMENTLSRHISDGLLSQRQG